MNDQEGLSHPLPPGVLVAQGGPAERRRRYWYPLSYMGSLAFQPSALVGLTPDLKVPRFPLTCNIRPSVFAYPPPVAKEETKTVPIPTTPPPLHHPYSPSPRFNAIMAPPYPLFLLFRT